MDKKVAVLLGGAISALALAVPAQAMPTSQSLAAGSFEELLQPVQNASTVLQQIDENGAQNQPVGGQLVLVRHHHHHHHRVIIRRRHHHHHHHVVIMRRHHHHHHHHHHFLRHFLPH